MAAGLTAQLDAVGLVAARAPKPAKPPKLTTKNRTIWTGDNLPIMRGLNSESVGLIYLDPPFNSNQDYAAPIGSKAAVWLQ